MNDNSTQDGLIFVWGQHGKKLADLDKDRVFAIGLKDCNYHLSTSYNEDILDLLDEINEKGLDEDLTEKVEKINDLDNLFRETHDLLIDSQDTLSLGSLLTGEVDKSGRFANILKTNKEGE